MIRVKAKSDRLNEIRRLVLEKKISTQDEIVTELREQGFEATQATVSRDIVELRLHKIRTDSGSIYILPQTGVAGEAEYLRRMLREFVNTITRAGNLIVVKTAPGAAQGVGSAIDNTRWEEIVGTIAGDDTILVVTENSETGVLVLKRLEDLKSS